MNNREETIAAIVTPLGEGGVAIVRISGKKALSATRSIFSKNPYNFESHKAYLGHVIDGEGKRIDQALCLCMKAPSSYTGEDVVEFQCHGGIIAVHKVLKVVLAQGIRLAKPGEFTYRAFMNGKIDLAQAESVQALIGAKSEKAYISAQRHLEGRLSTKILFFQKELVTLAAILEAWVDFPEEDLAFTSFSSIMQRLQSLHADMTTLLATYEEGKRVEQGPKIVIVGAPNAGKSSLMNALLDHSRAIVTPVAGTTRDTIESNFILGGRSMLLVDTAGLRSTDCEIERLGIERSLKAIEQADLLLWVIDGAAPSNDPILDALPKEKKLRIVNKQDLKSSIAIEADIEISALKKMGIDELRRKIDQKLAAHYLSSQDELLISSHRHKQILDKAVEGMKRVIAGLKNGLSAEFIAADVKEVLHVLGEMIGQNVTEEILDSIFSQFCIGK